MNITNLNAKQIVEQAELRVAQAVKRAQDDIQREADATLEDLRDVAEGVVEFDPGLGDLLRLVRTEAVFATSFAAIEWDKGAGMSIGGAELRFPEVSITVPLDRGGDRDGPRLPAGRHRVIVLITPVDPLQSERSSESNSND